MNAAYCESGPTSREKTKVLHSTVNRMILNNLGIGYTGDGDGLPNRKERTIKAGGQSWKPDGFFYMDCGCDSLVTPRGGVIDYKAPMSNIPQNLQNVIKTISGESTRVRPYGYTMAAFFLLPDQAPYFDSKGRVKSIQKVTDSMLSEIVKYSQIGRGNDGSCDLVGVCLYHLDGFKMDEVYDKEDYAKMLKDFSGNITYVPNKNISTNGRFIYNDPVLFSKTYASMVSKRFSGTGKNKTFAELFQETPIDEQEKYLIAHGKIAEVPECLFVYR